MQRPAINHVLSRLLSEGVIEGDLHPEIYEFAVNFRARIEEHLRNLGMELVILPDAQLVHARNMTDGQLEALAEKLGCDPVTSVCGHYRLNYYDSVAVIFFRMSLDQELREGGAPIWIPEPEVYEAMGRSYAAGVAEDRVGLEEKVRMSINRLKENRLLSVRAMGKWTLYRGRPLLQAAFSRNQVSEFARAMNLVADEHGSGIPNLPALVDFESGPSLRDDGSDMKGFVS